MRLFWNCLGVMSVLAMGAFGARPAVADSYALVGLAIDNGRGDIGLYSNGSAVLYDLSCRETNYDQCYRTYAYGVQRSVSTQEPTAPFDNGIACTFLVLGYHESGRCNGNYRAFFVHHLDPLTQFMVSGIYAGALDDPTLLIPEEYGDAGGLFLNVEGDLVFDDLSQEMIYQAYNTTPTPEPGSVVLLVTGLAAGALLQRRVLG